MHGREGGALGSLASDLQRSVGAFVCVGVGDVYGTLLVPKYREEMGRSINVSQSPAVRIILGLHIDKRKSVCMFDRIRSVVLNLSCHFFLFHMNFSTTHFGTTCSHFN